MTRHRTLVVLACAAMLLVAQPARAQIFGPLIVFDPSNYAQAVQEVLNTLRQYQHWIQQARRLPGDMATRYRTPAIPWRNHAPAEYVQPALTALNIGDPGGTLYSQILDRLLPLADVLPRLPAALRQRVLTDYTTLQLADSVAKLGIDQAGRVRTNASTMINAIQAAENDAVAISDDFHTQTALLNKINGASVLGLRIAERSTQFLLNTVEQLVVDNKRKRDSEVKLMNATITQWRYGREYGADLFGSTAANLDTWRPF